jgi:hypothetical protein
LLADLRHFVAAGPAASGQDRGQATGLGKAGIAGVSRDFQKPATDRSVGDAASDGEASSAGGAQGHLPRPNTDHSVGDASIGGVAASAALAQGDILKPTTYVSVGDAASDGDATSAGQAQGDIQLQNMNSLDHVKAKIQAAPPVSLDSGASDSIDGDHDRLLFKDRFQDMPLFPDHDKARIQAEPPLTLDPVANSTVDNFLAPVLFVCGTCDTKHLEVVERCRRCWMPRPGSGAPRLPDFPVFDDRGQGSAVLQRAAEAGSAGAGPSPATSGPFRSPLPRTTRARRATAAGQGR